MIQIYNTLSGRKEEFIPQQPGAVSMYVCGPTVYNYFHIGNARAFLFFDLVRRYLRFKGFKVKYVQNFTDVDDKIIRVANEENIPAIDVANRYIEAYHADASGLGIQQADVHPRVTEHLPEIIEMIDRLIQQGHAYVSEGDVYFKTKSFPEYGKLSNQSLDDLQAGARIEVSEKKQNPLDFVLWKAAKPGEISWQSPWGEGRPGWHIECSAMSKKYLGETFDIHAGGHDLIFPHHENEIAQSEACNGKQFARYWMHNGYININDEKMSKSLGNFVTTHELLQRYDSRALRFFLISSHYRNPVNFSEDIIRQAVQALDRIDTSLSNIEHWLQSRAEDESKHDAVQTIDREALLRPFIEAMDDDFNTADALAEIFNLVKAANLYMNSEGAGVQGVEIYRSVLLELLDILGLSPQTGEDALAEEVEKLIHERDLARKNKDYHRADQIREQLQDMDIILEDTPQGVRWKRK